MDHDIAPLSGHAMRCVWYFPRPVIWIATGFSSAKFFVKILQREFGEQPVTLIPYTSSLHLCTALQEEALLHRSLACSCPNLVSFVMEGHMSEPSRAA